MNNYKAIVSEITRTIPIEGADRIHIAIVMGEQVIVSKDWKVGKIGLFFPADTKLSHDFCHNNNLYRRCEKNKNPEKTGFFEDARRVRCQPFLKVKSEGFFCEVSALDYIDVEGVYPWAAKGVGHSLDTMNNIKFCEKYVSEKTKNAITRNKNKKKTSTISTPMFNKHVDSEQFKYSLNKINIGDIINFHAKVHGTSARVSYTKVVKKPKNIVDKILNKFGLFKSESWQYLCGSRNVVLHPDQYPNGYGSNQFRFDVLELLKPFLEKGMTVYGEIAGYANGKPIMGTHDTTKLNDKKYNKKYGKTMTYTYGCKEHQFRFHVYRISMTNESGYEVDFTNEQLIKWCTDRNLLFPYAVHPTMIFRGDRDMLVDLVNDLTEREHVLCEDYIDPTHISEGIILRVDSGTLTPKFYKSKSYPFKVLEGIQKESGELDIEESS